MEEQKITAVAFLHRDWKLFVAKRASTKVVFPGMYELPWGHIEFGEWLEEWLQREMAEEFHIDVVVDKVFDAFTHVGYNNTRHTVQLTYLVTMKDEQQEIKLNLDDHSDYQRIHEDDVGKFLWNNPEEMRTALIGFQILKEKNK